jgi:hypothetical protein
MRLLQKRESTPARYRIRDGKATTFSRIMNGNSPWPKDRTELESRTLGATMNAAHAGMEPTPPPPHLFTPGLHRTVALAMQELTRAGEPPDLTNVTRHIHSTGNGQATLPPDWPAIVTEWIDWPCVEPEPFLEELKACYITEKAAATMARALELPPKERLAAIIQIGRVAEKLSANGSNKAAEIRAMLDARRVKHEEPPPEPVPVFLLNGTRISTAGNLLVPSGRAKAGKTAVLSAIAAAAMGAPWEADTLGFTAAANPEGRALVWIDTEQSPHDAWKALHAACKRAGLSEPPAWVRMFCLTDLEPGERREALRAELETAAKDCGGIYAFIVDGCADLIFGVNDETEALALAGELHALAIQHAAPGICNLHENPTGDNWKTRGHLGSQLERKAETNLRVTKNEAGESLVCAPGRNRGPSIPEAGGTWFKWDDETGMHSTFRMEPSKPDKVEQSRIQAEGIFGRDAVLTTGEILARHKAADVSEPTANRRIAAWMKDGIIRKRERGEYELILSPASQAE